MTVDPEHARVEARRLAALYETGILYTEPSSSFDRLCTLAARMFDVPVAVVGFMDERRLWFKARFGADLASVERSIAFSDETLRSDAVLVVEDMTRDSRFAGNPMVLGSPFVRFYAGAPICVAPGLRLGILAVLDTVPRPFDDTDRHALATLAQVARTELRLVQAARSLRQALSVGPLPHEA